MNLQRKNKFPKYKWDELEEGDIIDDVIEEPETEDPLPEPVPIEETYSEFKPSPDFKFLAILGGIAAVATGVLIYLFKGEPEEKKDEDKEERVPKVIKKTITKYVQRAPSKKKDKDKVIKEETEEEPGSEFF